MAILAAAGLALRLYRMPGFAWAATGAGLPGLALATWFVIVAPANAILATWQAGPEPADFHQVRLRWETGHMVVALLKTCGFVAIAMSTTAAARRG